MISVQVNAVLAQTRLRKLAATLGNRVPTNKAVAAKLTAMVLRNFDTESHDGEPWAALAPSTTDAKKRAGKEKILQWTTAMKQSFLPFSDNNLAGVGALSSKEHAELSKIHEEGIGLPARPMLPGRGPALEEAIKIYSLFVSRAVKS